ncbi:carboxymuconolactone decarboxylase family protein [Halobellus sp. GM3]|uniref:carboxymuconolactone decarboxylase family protein n=1 Tax=Halobellus sp. GM3 TaxID=3458410 RepID=UPI00403D97BC
MARFSHVDPAELPSEKRDLLDTLSDEENTDGDRGHSLRGGTLNVYRTLGLNLPLLEGFRRFMTVVWESCGLSPHEREVVILATSYYVGSPYEWHQHVRVGLDKGLKPAQILAISREQHDEISPEFAALVTYASQLVEGTIDDEAHELLATHYDEETILGVAMLSGCYLGLSRVLQALEVEVESEFVGWDLENL